MPPSENDGKNERWGCELKEENRRVCEGGKYIQNTLCSTKAGSSVLPDVSMIKMLRQGAA